MSKAVGVAGLYDALRSAARASDSQAVVALRDGPDRVRVAGALGLASDAKVVESATFDEARARAGHASFGLAVVDDDLEAGLLAPAADTLRPDLILVADGDPGRCTEAFARGVDAVMPRPLPDSDAVLRSHLRWLASCRRQRVRAHRLKGVLARGGGALSDAEPALVRALLDIAGVEGREASVLVVGDGALLRLVGGSPVQAAAEVAVVSVTAADEIEPRLQEARARARGAALVVVDAASTGARLTSALYAGARAYVERGRVALLGEVVAIAAAKRRLEIVGRRLVETLARFGALAEVARPTTSAGGLDPSALAVARGADAFVPSGHDILVVDEDVVALTVLREILRRGGYRVTTASSGGEARAQLGARPFDLVLSDASVAASADLSSACARVAESAPALVLMSAETSPDTANEHIEKPIRDSEALRFRIRRALSRRDELSSRPPGPAVDRPVRVLVVEADGPRRALLLEHLARRYQVSAASDDEEALALLKLDRYDLVLADRNLPSMSGLRAIDQGKRLLPHCSSVLYTAYPSHEFVAAVGNANELAADDLASLADKIEGALRSRGGILLG